MTANNGSDQEPKSKDGTRKGTKSSKQYGAFITNSIPDKNEFELSDQYGPLLQDNPPLQLKILYYLLTSGLFQIFPGIIFYFLYPPPCHNSALCSNLSWWQYLYSFIIMNTIIINSLWLYRFNFNFKLAYKAVLKVKFSISKYLWSLVGLLYPFIGLILFDSTTFANKSDSGGIPSVLMLMFVVFVLSYCVEFFIHNTIRLVFRFVSAND